MKRNIMTLCLLILSMGSLLAQGAFQEYLQCHTDKDFYLSGERLWFRLWSVDGKDMPRQGSRIAYVELVGTEQDGARCMVELKDASASGVLDLPFTLPSGRYQLRAYTRNMLNLGQEAVFSKEIAVLNTLRYEAGRDQVSLVNDPIPPVVFAGGNLKVTTDRAVYGTREKVGISLGQLPQSTRVSVSVARQDGYRQLPSRGYATVPLQDKGIEPEVESQLIAGRYVSDSGRAATHANLSFQSPAVHYYPAEVNGDRMLFRTPLLSGVETVYTGVDAGGYIELESPYASPRLSALPVLELAPADEAALQERSLGLQASRYFGTDSLQRSLVAVDGLHRYQLTRHYDMDEYRRFNTFRETFTEYVRECSTTQRNGTTYITMYDEFTSRQNSGNTLVLLDGVAVMNHEDLLNYNPRLCRYMDIYYGHYLFGDQVYVGILNVRTPKGQADRFNLPENTRRVEFSGPQTPTRAPLVCGDDTLVPLPGNLPDARHTLYWNSGTDSTRLECLTSDLKGTYVIRVEGITPEGEKLEGTATFTVE